MTLPIFGYLCLMICYLHNTRAQESVVPSFVTGSCGGTYKDAKSGYIASPGYPTENYPDDTNCNYTIQAESGNIISYKLLFMNLEKDDNNVCGYDFIQLYDDNTPIGGPICGDNTIPLDSTSSNILRVVFVSDPLSNFKGFVLQWSVLNLADLKPSFNCNFDGPVALCPGWKQSIEDDVDWKFARGRTPTVDTGPSRDHSDGSDGRYAYIEASDMDENGKAILISPSVPSADKQEYCLKLWYHMYGRGIGQLNIIQFYEGDSEGKFLLTIENSQGNEWKQAEVNLKGTERDFTIFIRATKGNSFYADLAIDDISIETGRCPESGTAPSDLSDVTTEANTFFPTSGYLDASTVSACNEDDFFCDDGFGCITQEYVCDGLLDCADGSDEKDCDTSSRCPPTFEWQTCGSICNRTCSDGKNDPPCVLSCAQRCGCPSSAPVLRDNRCIKYEECPLSEIPLDVVDIADVKDAQETALVLVFQAVRAADSYRIRVTTVADPNTVVDSKEVQSTEQDDKGEITVTISDLLPVTTYQIQIYSVQGDKEVLSPINLEFATAGTIPETTPVSEITQFGTTNFYETTPDPGKDIDTTPPFEFTTVDDTDGAQVLTTSSEDIAETTLPFEFTTAEGTTKSEELTTAQGKPEETTSFLEFTTAGDTTEAKDLTTSPEEVQETTPAIEFTTADDTSELKDLTTSPQDNEETTSGFEFTTVKEATEVPEGTTLLETVEETSFSFEVTTAGDTAESKDLTTSSVEEETTPGFEFTTAKEATEVPEVTTPPETVEETSLFLEATTAGDTTESEDLTTSPVEEDETTQAFEFTTGDETAGLKDLTTSPEEVLETTQSFDITTGASNNVETTPSFEFTTAGNEGTTASFEFTTAAFEGPTTSPDEDQGTTLGIEVTTAGDTSELKDLTTSPQDYEETTPSFEFTTVEEATKLQEVTTAEEIVDETTLSFEFTTGASEDLTTSEDNQETTEGVEFTTVGSEDFTTSPEDVEETTPSFEFTTAVETKSKDLTTSQDNEETTASFEFTTFGSKDLTTSPEDEEETTPSFDFTTAESRETTSIDEEEETTLSLEITTAEEIIDPNAVTTAAPEEEDTTVPDDRTTTEIILESKDLTSPGDEEGSTTSFETPTSEKTTEANELSTKNVDGEEKTTPVLDEGDQTTPAIPRVAVIPPLPDSTTLASTTKDFIPAATPDAEATGTTDGQQASFQFEKLPVDGDLMLVNDMTDEGTYPSNHRKLYNIDTAPGYIIKATFTKLSVFCDDTIRFYNGFFESEEVASICGLNTDSQNLPVIYSESKQITILFQTNLFNESTGFEIDLQAVKLETITNDVECGSAIIEQNGFLHSPNFTSHVKTEQCQYVFNMEHHQYMEIDFVSLNLGVLSEEGCNSSRVTVQAFNFSAEYCGVFRPTLFTVKGDVTITMYSETEPGAFLLSYEIKDCPATQIFSNYPTACDKRCVDGEMEDCTGGSPTPRCFCPPERPLLYENECITYSECKDKTRQVISTTTPSIDGELTTIPLPPTTTSYEKEVIATTADKGIEGSVETTDISTRTTQSGIEVEISGEGSGETEGPEMRTKVEVTTDVKISGQKATEIDLTAPWKDKITTTAQIRQETQEELTTQQPIIGKSFTEQTSLGGTTTTPASTAVPLVKETTQEDTDLTTSPIDLVRTTEKDETTILLTEIPKEESTALNEETTIPDEETTESEETTQKDITTALNEITTIVEETTTEEEPTTLVLVTDAPKEESTALSEETTIIDDKTTLQERTTEADITTNELDTTETPIEESTLTTKEQTTNPPVETTIIEDTTYRLEQIPDTTTAAPKIFMPSVVLSLVNITDEKVCFSFVSNPEGSLYKTEISELDSDFSNTFMITDTLPLRLYRECIDELEPDTRYVIRVITADDYITSEWSRLEFATRRQKEFILVQVLRTFGDGACIQISTAADGDVYRFSISATNSSDLPVIMEATATGDMLMKCVQGLEAGTFYTATVTSISGTVYDMSSSVAYFTTDEVIKTPEVVYEQTRELKEWRSTYLNWRSTFSSWITSFNKYAEKMSKSGSRDEKFECPKQTQIPPCAEDPILLKDRNDCIFFMCMSPPIDDDFSQRDVIGWEEEYTLFRDYFLPQWETMFEEEMRLIEEEEKDA